MNREQSPLENTEARFDNTSWTLILPAVSQSSPGAREALERLCRLYWPPLYAFLRKQGRSPEDAQDLTQGFFLHLLSGNRLESVNPSRGKFRSFLLACLGNYVANERDRVNALKRGAGKAIVPLSTSETETQYGPQPADPDDPYRLFERRWASTLLAEVLRQLREIYIRSGKGEVFDVLHPFLIGDAAHGGYREGAAKLGMSEGAARVAATRLRKEFRELLRKEVGRTLENQEEIDEEIRYLITVSRGI